MDNVLDIEIDPEIEIVGKNVDKMPDEIKNRLLATMTIACQRYKCHWTELTWEVKPSGVIHVNRKAAA